MNMSSDLVPFLFHDSYLTSGGSAAIIVHPWLKKASSSPLASSSMVFFYCTSKYHNTVLPKRKGDTANHTAIMIKALMMTMVTPIKK